MTPNPTMSEELKLCKCGKKPEMKVTSGGGTAYYGIYCECGNNNRNFDSSIASIGVGVGNFPPMEKEIAIKDWNSR